MFQIVFQIFSFLSITTTGMVARACADGDNRTVRRALANSTILALAFGGATCVGLNVFAEDVLRVIGCSPDLVGAAAPYLRVRAFAIPAVLFCTSAQGGCLGQQDAKTPLLIFLCAGLVNVVGDVWAVSGSGLNLGLTGAAWATLAAQYFSAAVFLLVLSRKRMLPRRWSHWRLPTSGEMRDITSVSGMLLLGSLCRMGVYTMMTMTALALGTLTMAAHQVALQVFWTLTYFVDPLFVAATSFIARDHGRRPTRVRRMATTLMGLSLGVGCVIAVACAAIPTFAVGVFTADLELQALIRTITPLMGLSQLVSALVLVTEGVLIGCGDLKYLLNVHCLNFVVLGGVLCWVKHSSAGLWGIWIAVLMNQTLRMTQHGAHMWRGGDRTCSRGTKPGRGNRETARERESKRGETTSVGWDDGRRKRSSRTHRGPRATRGIGRVVSIIFDREGGRGRRRGGERRIVVLYFYLRLCWSVGQYILYLKFLVPKLPRRCDIVVGVDRGASSSGRSTTLAIVGGARVGRARDVPPASSTGGSSYGDVDVLSPAGLDALKTRLGARPRPSPSVFETLRGSSALGRHPLTSSAPPSLAPIPPEHDDWRARVDGMRALTAALEPPPPRTPTRTPPRPRRPPTTPRSTIPSRRPPTRPPRTRPRTRPQTTLLPAPSEPRRSRPVPPQVRASPRGPARAPPRRRRRRRVRIRLRARRSRRRGPVPPPPRLPALRRRLRTPAPPSDVSRGRPRERRPRPHGDDAMRRRVARTEPRAAINERARGSRTRVSRANARASRRPSRARARRLASRESHDVSRGHRTRDADVCLGRIGGRATRSARVFRRLRRDVAETRRTRRRNGVAEGETTPPRGRPRSSGGERAMGQRRTRRAGRFQPRRARTRSRPRRRPRRRERVGRCGCGVTDADVSRGGGVARAHRGVGARGVGARPRGGRAGAGAAASPFRKTARRDSREGARGDSRRRRRGGEKIPRGVLRRASRARGDATRSEIHPHTAMDDFHEEAALARDVDALNARLL